MRVVKKLALLFSSLVPISCGDGNRSEGGITLCGTNDDCLPGHYCDDGICTWDPGTLTVE